MGRPITELLQEEQIEMVSSRENLKTNFPMSKVVTEETKLKLAVIGIETFTLDFENMQKLIQSLEALKKDYLIGRVEVFARKRPYARIN